MSAVDHLSPKQFKGYIDPRGDETMGGSDYDLTDAVHGVWEMSAV